MSVHTVIATNTCNIQYAYFIYRKASRVYRVKLFNKEQTDEILSEAKEEKI
jgi:hypothetical protein